MPFDDPLSERLPTPEEIAQARQATQVLARTLTKQGALNLRLKRNGAGEDLVQLPPAVSKLVLDLLSLIAKGETVTLVPVGAELTTQEAADMLNVSRPFLIKLIDERKLPHHKVGRHRRIRAQDLFDYKRHRDADREKALDELVRLGQEIDAE